MGIHVVIIEDSKGDAVDARYYCCDTCAREDPMYAGWNGCHDLEHEYEECAACGEVLIDERLVTRRVARAGAWGCADPACDACYETVLESVPRDCGIEDCQDPNCGLRA